MHKNNDVFETFSAIIGAAIAGSIYGKFKKNFHETFHNISWQLTRVNIKTTTDHDTSSAVYDRQSYHLKMCKYYENYLKNAKSLQRSG